MAKGRKRAAVTCSAVVALVSAVGMPPAEAAHTGAGDGALNVRVVNSVDGSGAYTPAIDTGIAGAPVVVTDDTVAGQAVTVYQGPPPQDGAGSHTRYWIDNEGDLVRLEARAGTDTAWSRVDLVPKPARPVPPIPPNSPVTR